MVTEILVAVGGTVAGTVGTFIVAKLNGWWDDKTSIPAKTLKLSKANKRSNDRLWIAVIALREAVESSSTTVKDRKWAPPPEEKDEDDED